MKVELVTIYKCRRCGQEIKGEDRYNTDLLFLFPKCDAPPTISHQCTPVCIGIADLAGLTEQARKQPNK